MSVGMPIPIKLRSIFRAVLRLCPQGFTTNKSTSLSGPISSRAAKEDNLFWLNRRYNSPHDFLKDLLVQDSLFSLHCGVTCSANARRSLKSSVIHTMLEFAGAGIMSEAF